MNNKKVWIIGIVLFFLTGAVGSYLYMHKFAGNGNSESEKTPPSIAAESEDFFTLRIYYPAGNDLTMIEKKLPRRIRQLSVAEAVIEEFFKGPENDDLLNIPQNVKLLGLYKDAQQILYIDLSDEIRRNFQGDAHSEYLLLKALHESLVSNLQEFRDYKILVEGKELESLGGHLYLKYTLSSITSYVSRPENKAADEQ